MSKGEDILRELIGKKLKDGVIQSFIRNGEIVNEINYLYLKFDNWIHIPTENETLAIQIKESTIKYLESLEFSSAFEYPIQKIKKDFQELIKIIGLTLQNFAELTDSECGNITCGIKFIFETGKFISTYDKNGNSFITFNRKLPGYLKEKYGRRNIRH